MRKSILAAVVMAAAAAGLATTAEARVDQTAGFSRPDVSITKAGMSRNFRSHANRHASKGKRSRVARHSHGGGYSRSCLTSAARGLLNRIESRFGAVSVISTCRPGAVIATSGKPSKHRNGQAIDFDAGGRKREIVQWLIANHHSGGTMTYRDMSHIHVDVGYRFVKLGANSGHG